MRIAQVVKECPWGEFRPGLLEVGVGGRETCALQVSRRLAESGHEVLNFSGDGPGATYERGGGVERYLPLSMAGDMLQNVEFDGVLAVEMPELWTDPRIAERQAGARRITHYQVAHVSPEVDVTSIPEGTTTWGALSPWHARFLGYQGVAGDFAIMPNGVDISRFPRELWGTRSDTPRFFYSSSPDRGLWNLLEAWPFILEQWPGAQLDVCYGLENVFAIHQYSHNREGEMVARIREGMGLPGVNYRGKVGQDELALLQMQAWGLLYPCDPIQPTETGCITVVEACAAGAVPVITDADCLGEEFSDVAVVTRLGDWEPESYADAVIETFEERDVDAMREHARAFAERRDWTTLGDLWTSFFEGDTGRLSSTSFFEGNPA